MVAENDFQTLEGTFYRAMLESDADTIEKMMDDDCVYTHSFGARDTKASYLRKVREGFFTYHKIDFTQDHVFERGGTATIVGTMSGVVTAGGVDRRLINRRTSVWAKSGEDWKLISFQPTPWLDR